MIKSYKIFEAINSGKRLCYHMSVIENLKSFVEYGISPKYYSKGDAKNIEKYGRCSNL